MIYVIAVSLLFVVLAVLWATTERQNRILAEDSNRDIVKMINRAVKASGERMKWLQQANRKLKKAQDLNLNLWARIRDLHEQRHDLIQRNDEANKSIKLLLSDFQTAMNRAEANRKERVAADNAWIDLDTEVRQLDADKADLQARLDDLAAMHAEVLCGLIDATSKPQLFVPDPFFLQKAESEYRLEAGAVPKKIRKKPGLESERIILTTAHMSYKKSKKAAK